MNKLMIGAGVVVLAGVGWLVVSQQTASKAMSDSKVTAEQQMAEKAVMEEKMMMEQKAMEEKAMMEKDAMMKENDQMMKKDDTTMKKEDQAMVDDEVMMKKPGAYVPYDESKLSMANSGDVVLFFKASWCPSCRTVDADIKANLSAIPSTLTIMEVDYDASTALKQKFGVTTQHTFVQVDSNGALLKKWNGGSTLSSVVAQVQ